jgi:BirA family biotin operon repressor/biotin-[acetyl-CoA-carboxylase] ligase
MGSFHPLPDPSGLGGPGADAPLSWRTELLWQQLRTLLPGIGIEVVERTPSTNTQLLARARARADRASEAEAALVHRSVESRAFGRRADDNQPFLLIAEQQTQGRGRQGRSWQSSRGASLTFSLALPFQPIDWSGLSLAVGLAVADALDPPSAWGPEGGPRIGLKWPNDLWLVDPPEVQAAHGGRPGRKLGGVLIETVGTAGSGARRHTVVGIGLNIAPIGSSDQHAAWLEQYACLRELQPNATPPDALMQVIQPLAATLVAFERDGFGPFMARYAARDLLDGRIVRTTSPEAALGRACGVSALGALRIEIGDRVVEVTSGEVSVRLGGGDDPACPPAAPATLPTLATPLDDGQACDA